MSDPRMALRVRSAPQGDNFNVVNSQMCTDPAVGLVCPALTFPPSGASPPAARVAPPPPVGVQSSAPLLGGSRVLVSGWETHRRSGNLRAGLALSAPGI